jgi:magnesium transporter
MTAVALGVVARALAEGFVRRHAGEVAHLAELSDRATLVGIFEDGELDTKVPVLQHLTPPAATVVVESLESERAARMLRQMDPARAAVILGRVDTVRREEILSSFPVRDATEVRELISYPADTAGSLMDVHVATFRQGARAGDVLTRVREGVTGLGRTIVVVDDDGRLTGVTTIADLALADPQALVRNLAEAAQGRIEALTPREDIVEELSRTKASSLPVVDTEGRVVGIIRHEALVRAVHEEATLDMQTMVGVSAEERALSPIAFAVRKRLPWLQVNLLTAFLAASIVGVFEDTIAQFTALAVLLPVVAGQSGNTGAQALAVTMRGLSLREIRLRHWWQIVVKEATVGLVNGIGVAVTTSLAVFLWSRSTGLAVVIGTSMVVSMACAGLAGAAVPLVLVAVRQDPAQSSSIILTTVTDVVGFFSFLGLATLLSSTL